MESSSFNQQESKISLLITRGKSKFHILYDAKYENLKSSISNIQNIKS